MSVMCGVCHIFLFARAVGGGGRQKIYMAILELFLQFRVCPSAPNQPFDISDRILKQMRRRNIITLFSDNAYTAALHTLTLVCALVRAPSPKNRSLSKNDTMHAVCR
jgi:hypothetical protein